MLRQFCASESAVDATAARLPFPLTVADLKPALAHLLTSECAKLCINAYGCVAILLMHKHFLPGCGGLASQGIKCFTTAAFGLEQRHIASPACHINLLWGFLSLLTAVLCVKLYVRFHTIVLYRVLTCIVTAAVGLHFVGSFALGYGDFASYSLTCFVTVATDLHFVTHFALGCEGCASQSLMHLRAVAVGLHPVRKFHASCEAKSSQASLHRVSWTLWLLQLV